MVKGGKKPTGKAAAKKSGTNNSSETIAGQSQKLPMCVTCAAMITSEITALNCDGCSTANSCKVWKCIECLGLSLETYNALISAGTEMKWLCEGGSGEGVRGRDGCAGDCYVWWKCSE